MGFLLSGNMRSNLGGGEKKQIFQVEKLRQLKDIQCKELFLMVFLIFWFLGRGRGELMLFFLWGLVGIRFWYLVRVCVLEERRIFKQEMWLFCLKFFLNFICDKLFFINFGIVYYYWGEGSNVVERENNQKYNQCYKVWL